MTVSDRITTNDKLMLSRAVLLYEDDDKKRCAATVHEVQLAPQKAPQMLPGRLLGAGELVEVLQRLSAAPLARQVLPERLLYFDSAMMLWWLPECQRGLHFTTADLKGISGKPVAHPPLLFKAEPGALFVFALGQNQRPTNVTPLLVAPYYNLYSYGKMCRGNISLPETLSPTDGEFTHWEKAFFETNFTHSNDGRRCVHPGGHNGMWQELAQTHPAPFRAEWLLPTKLKVSDLLTVKDKRERDEL